MDKGKDCGARKDKEHPWLHRGYGSLDEEEPGNASLDSANAPWWLYAVGYKHAADKLVGTIATKHCSEDILVYPIAYLYRHYLELMLKELLPYCYALGDLSIPAMQATHNLSALLEEVLSAIGPVLLKCKALPYVKEAVEAFDVIDKKSTCFRYPVGRDGWPELPGVNYISLIALHQLMSNAETELIDLWYEIRGRLERRLPEGRFLSFSCVE